MAKIFFISLTFVILLGITLFSTVTGLNEINITNTIDYFNSHLGLAFASDKYDNLPMPKIYVNTLSYNNADLTILNSCDSLPTSVPCILVDPRGEGQEEIFIADPALQSTRTVVSVTIIEKDEFNPDIESTPHCLDQYRAITSFTVSTFNGVHGVFLFCDNITEADVGEKIFDITYSFIEPAMEIDDSNCDCDRPSNLLLKYDGPNPDTVTIEIYKKEGEVGKMDKLLDEIHVVSGNILVQSEHLGSGRDKLESNTIFRIMDNGEQIGLIPIHTSCSKPLFIGQEFTTNVGQDNMIVLTVLDGTDTTGKTTIPEAFCST